MHKVWSFLLRVLVRLPDAGWIFVGFWVGSAILLLTKSDFWFLVVAGAIWIANLHNPIAHWIYRKPPFRGARALRHRLLRVLVLRVARPRAYIVVDEDGPGGSARQEAVRAFVAAHPETRYLRLHKGVTGTLAVGVDLDKAPAVFAAFASEVGFRRSPVKPAERKTKEPGFEGDPEAVFLYPESYLEETDLVALRAALPAAAEVFDGSLVTQIMDNIRDLWPWDSWPWDSLL